MAVAFYAGLSDLIDTPMVGERAMDESDRNAKVRQKWKLKLTNYVMEISSEPLIYFSIILDDCEEFDPALHGQNVD